MTRVPKYRLHKPTGQAIVTFPVPGGRRKDYYLGKFGTPESRKAYTRLVGEASQGGRLTAPTGPTSSASVNEVLLRYWEHAKQHYRNPETGEQTGEVRTLQECIRIVRKVYGSLPAHEFTPLSFKAVRKGLIDNGLSRGVINARMNRVRRIFKWAASEMLVPFGTYQALTTVTGLGRGRSNAREADPVLPVDMDDVNRTLPYLPRHVAGLVRFLAATGARPGEACRARMADIDTSGEVWVYRIGQHKTAYRGRPRLVPLGPKAKAVVEEFRTADPTDFLFSPMRQREERYERIRANRKTKVQPSQADRRERAAKKLPGRCYTPVSFAAANRLLSGTTQVRVLPGLIAGKPTMAQKPIAPKNRVAAFDLPAQPGEQGPGMLFALKNVFPGVVDQVPD